MAEVDLTIAGRVYRVACRDGEEAELGRAAALVDAKSREALAGLGSLSESRQLLFAALMLADQLIEKKGGLAALGPDPAQADRLARLADRLEQLADTLEQGQPQA